MSNEKLISEKGLDELLDKLESYGVIDEDLDLTLPANPVRDRWHVWLDVLQWTLESGPAEGVFKDRPMGHCTIWGCKWSTSGGVVGPNQILPLEVMNPGQAKAELEDWVHLNLYGGVAARACTEDIARARELIKGLDQDPEGNGYKARQFLEQNRNYSIEYICPWDPPKNVRYKYLRPGWPDEREFQKQQPEHKETTKKEETKWTELR
jgi:hypothetical protein